MRRRFPCRSAAGAAVAITETIGHIAETAGHVAPKRAVPIVRNARAQARNGRLRWAEIRTSIPIRHGPRRAKNRRNLVALELLAKYSDPVVVFIAASVVTHGKSAAHHSGSRRTPTKGGVHSSNPASQHFNPQPTHLSQPGSCSDERGHLS
mgnify:FL=1